MKSRPHTVRTALVFVFSLSLVAIVTWLAPSLSAASLNMLFRLRGEFPPPADLVVLAIDDQSLQRVGQWPWRRSVMAGALDRLTQAGARSIGLDVIYAEPSVFEEDQQLAAAIARNGRVVLPAQLYEAPAGADSAAPATEWLLPLPALADAARGIGHAHVSPGVDGMARSIQLSKADDEAHRLWAFSLEVIRVAESISAQDLEEGAGLFRFGTYRLSVRDEAAASSIDGVSIVRQNEMWINYAGPTGSFRSYSIADLIDDRIPLSAFADKIVLIGATAESMGDTRVTPFMHYRAAHHQGGQEMPGVEIHANIINTIRGRLSLRSLPDWGSWVAGLVVVVLSALAVRWFDGWRQVWALLLVLGAVVSGSFLAFSRYLIIPPLAPMVTGLAAVIPLLLNRALAASRELDLKLAALVSNQQGFLLTDPQSGSYFINNQLGLDLPHTLAWKLRAVDDLTTRLLARMSFINRILSSMGEGVLVADLAGRIVFANREATQLLGCGQGELVGAHLADSLIERGIIDRRRLYEALNGVAQGHSSQLEFETSSLTPRYYSLLLSALSAGLDANAGRVISSSGSTLDLLPPEEIIGVVVLISDITKRVELDRMKTETLQLVSHELRTPLTSIQGLSNVLIKFPVAADESSEMLKTIHSEAVRLRETINRYLDLTRLESGAQRLHLAPVSCQTLIAECVRNLSLLAAERQIELVAQIDAEVPILQVDAQLLRQAVNNLLSNAIKYSPPETRILITAELRHAQAVIGVRDQGFGIPDEARERIFEKFYRLERDAASGIIGTGLGLPLVKEIVEQHGGRITFESAPPAGSTFLLHLPISLEKSREV
ncbi:MAG TPA: CHASE2 domain-containing protein [Blastocatellia bacterium]|nr:CHASE2 domain-containing protein [Blastocatellia bacterium]